MTGKDMMTGKDRMIGKDRQERPYGLWDSPFSAEIVSGASVRFGCVCHYDGYLYWNEGRPLEGGRHVLMRLDLSTGGLSELSGPHYSVGSRVHEYGGGDFLVCSGGIFFSNRFDNGIYKVIGGDVIDSDPISVFSDWRFADFIFDGGRDRLISVGEFHDMGAEDDGGLHFPSHMLVGLSLLGDDDSFPQILVEGCDFYSNPRLSPDGRFLLWVEWDLPYMPWERSRLMVGCVDDSGRITTMRCLLGGDGGGYIFQPEWGDNDRIFCISDIGLDFGTLHEISVGSGVVRRHCSLSVEMGRPQWVFGMRSWAFLGNDRIGVSGFKEGYHHIFLLCLESGRIDILDADCCLVDSLCSNFTPGFSAPDDELVLFGLFSYDKEFGGIGCLSLLSDRKDGIGCDVQVLRRSSTLSFSSEDLSCPHLLCVPPDKVSGDDFPVYALYYPPCNGSFICEKGELPPLIISAHGGPTAFADRGLKMKIQYWTSRGFAFLDVDYGGSWGYGSPYCRSLLGQWGIRDCADIIRACDYVVGEGLADGSRLFVSGSSAGGYTVLRCLCLYDIFMAGASYYGIGDLCLLAQTTHKFESGYLTRLVGDGCVLKSRSPLYLADRISSPVIFFQGLDDAVVPPSQSRLMAEALRSRAIDVCLEEFPGEGHGFRRGSTLISCLRSEYAFYMRALGIDVGS